MATSSSSKTLPIKWRRQVFDVAVTAQTTVEELKRALQALTGVPPSRQKLLGIKSRDLSPSTPVLSLSFRKLAMVGRIE